ncbi:MAG: hypothetical protein PHR83_05145 [Paludibacter sp.]|nr:hypothetical protein [Paludibacter sp.]
MKTPNGTGHEQNVTNLELLLTIFPTFGEAYNPPKPALTIPALTDLLQKGKLEINAVNAAGVVFQNAGSARAVEFDDFDKLITRSINSLRIAGVSAQTLAQAEAIVRDLRGKRASGLLSEEELAAEKAKGNNITQVKVHNSTIDSKIENLGKYVLFLAAVPDYKPNEAELKVEGLQAKLDAIKAKNTDTKTAEAGLEAARISRNTLMNTDNTGLVDTANDAKLYVKSAFGATSPQYKQISSIAFVKIK